MGIPSSSLSFSVDGDGDLTIKYFSEYFFFPSSFKTVRTPEEFKTLIGWDALLQEPVVETSVVKPTHSAEWYKTKNALEKALKVAIKKGRSTKDLLDELEAHLKD